MAHAHHGGTAKKSAAQGPLCGILPGKQCSHLRGAIIPTPRQQGVEEQEGSTASPRWSWARLLKRVFALDMARCPWCQRGSLRIIAAITQGEVIRTILRHLKLTVDPPPIAPARVRQEAFAWSSV